ncbi:glycosyltransferase family 2 protein [Candidatus Entotheonella palauensis]|uniref:glycosyltransferase family 2 protein n=1 Tax=Candidatus Entotheonella palauensis TaxID=93172 RepID=UPI0015C4D6C6|nr:glycosyltransferase family A protein [Candidatus Entotheonella palauensis]
MMAPFYSVIIPTYNRWPVLHEAMTSVFQQTCQDLELLIVDDGSTDATRTQVLQLAQQAPHPVRLLFCPRGGPAKARNVGLREAQGTFVAFLDSDDLWFADHLEAARQLVLRQPQALDFLFADTQLTRAAGLRASYLQGKSIETVPHDRDGTWRVFRRTIYPELIPASTVITSSAIIRRDLLHHLGGFDERLTPFGEDTDLWLRASAMARAAAGNWSVTVHRRKLADGLMNSGQAWLWRSKHIELMTYHLHGPGRMYKRLIGQRLADLYRERAVINLRQSTYGLAIRDLMGLIYYDPMALPKHLHLLVQRARRWLARRVQSA